MKILITGGNGYVARSLYSDLCKRYDVTAITRQDFDLANSQDTNNWFADKYFDVVIHTATAGGSRLKPDDESVLSDNLKMFYNLADNDRSFGRLISFGSGAELHATDKPYGFSKKVIADAIRLRENFYNIRIYAVFDENELDTRFIKANIYRYINKKDIIIHQDKYMDFFYMKDLVSLVNHYIIALDPKKEIDCCYNYTSTLKEIANIINNLDNYRIKIDILSDEFAPAYTGNYVDMLIPLIGLEQGIRNVYLSLK